MKHQGLLSGLLGCFFGILGIFTLGVIFVPLAAICSLVGLLRGAAGLSISGMGCSLLAVVLTVWGFVVSPSLWLVLAGILAANQSTTASQPDQRGVGAQDVIDAPTSTSVVMSPAPAPTASATPMLVYTKSLQKPADERALISTIVSARDQYNSGENDMAKGAARFARKQALCNLMQSAEVSKWIGEATSLTTTGDGKGIISIEIAPGISVKTWNNDLSDIEDDTLLMPTSDVFQEAMKLQEGDTVSFSGHFLMSDSDCFREASLTLKGSMTEPEFIFRFTQIGPAEDVQPTAPQPSEMVARPAPVPVAVAPTGQVTMYDKGLVWRLASSFI